MSVNQRKKRRGYGKAVIDGITQSKSEYILCVDSDGQCDPKDFKKLWNLREEFDIVSGIRKKRADSIHRKVYSAFFKLIFTLLYGNKIKDPSAPFVLFKKKNITPHLRYLKFLEEGFWWGFSGTIIKMELSICQIPIHHRLRINGKTQVYKLSKIPSIATRNLISLIKLRFS
jgi:glycosyltransferase involved in cell wall biosynthesis